jgi:hypothetical protein
MDTHLDKLKRNRVMQEALTQQIIERNQKMKETIAIPFQNMFTRTETPIINLQRVKAKEIYKEQLDMVKNHQDNEKKRREFERLESIDRMARGKKE